MPTTPPTISAAPTAPQRGVKSTFSTLLDAFVTWLVTAVTQFAAVATNVFNNATEAFNSATNAATSAGNAATSEANALASANAAAVTTGATLWVSGQTVAQDAAKISPLNRKTYRRKTASGSGSTDPALDTTNYVLLSAEATSSILLATATVSSAVVNIDFLNAFSTFYDSYQVRIKGLVATSTGSNTPNLMLQLAVGGAATGATLAIAGSIQVNSLGITGVVELQNVRTAGKMQIAVTQAVAHRSFDGAPTAISGAAMITASPVVASGLRLYFSDGTTFASGSVEIHGIKNS